MSINKIGSDWGDIDANHFGPRLSTAQGACEEARTANCNPEDKLSSETDRDHVADLNRWTDNAMLLLVHVVHKPAKTQGETTRQEEAL
eukprot:3228520-Rhodomonas_salina.1